MVADLPLLTDLHEQSRNQPETRIIIREKANHLDKLVNLFVDPFRLLIVRIVCRCSRTSILIFMYPKMIRSCLQLP